MINWKQKDSDKMAKRSSQIVDIFTKTINELKAVNGAIDGCLDKKEKERVEIEMEISKLSLTKHGNEKIINKIDKILE